MEQAVCISSNKRITNTIGTARFPCPKCGKYEIVRTQQMRRLGARYQCPSCQFEGPN